MVGIVGLGDLAVDVADPTDPLGSAGLETVVVDGETSVL